MNMRRTAPSEPSEPFEPAPPHSSPIKEQHVLGTNPEPLNPEFKTFFKNPVDTIAQDVIVLYPSLMKRPRSKERRKIIRKNYLTNLYECGKIIKSLEERWFFEN